MASGKAADFVFRRYAVRNPAASPAFRDYCQTLHVDACEVPGYNPVLHNPYQFTALDHFLHTFDAK
jgi:hypothetical protein